MKPATHANACSASTSELWPRIESASATVPTRAGLWGPVSAPVRQLGVDGGAGRAHRLEVGGLEHLAAKALEAAGQVADLETQDDARVSRAAAADDPPQQAPVGDTATVDVARAERQVRVAVGDRRDQPWNGGGIVGEGVV